MCSSWHNSKMGSKHYLSVSIHYHTKFFQIWVSWGSSEGVWLWLSIVHSSNFQIKTPFSDSCSTKNQISRHVTFFFKTIWKCKWQLSGHKTNEMLISTNTDSINQKWCNSHSVSVLKKSLERENVIKPWILRIMTPQKKTFRGGNVRH